MVTLFEVKHGTLALAPTHSVVLVV